MNEMNFAGFPGDTLIAGEIQKTGYSFVAKDHSLSSWLRSASDAEIGQFQDSWNDLRQDKYMADKGRYRFRRHLVMGLEKASSHAVVRHGVPHYQSSAYNRLNGDVKRWFAPIEDAVVEGRIWNALMCHLSFVFNEVEKLHSRNATEWLIEAHQFRIIATDLDAGQPTPEGVHRDGVSYVFMMAVARENITGGESGIYDHQRNIVRKLVMSPYECVYVDDESMKHGVSPVNRLVSGKDAYRDMLVVTFKRQSAEV